MYAMTRTGFGSCSFKYTNETTLKVDRLLNGGLPSDVSSSLSPRLQRPTHARSRRFAPPAVGRVPHPKTFWNALKLSSSHQHPWLVRAAWYYLIASTNPSTNRYD
jgi:hypothetical protein